MPSSVLKKYLKATVKATSLKIIETMIKIMTVESSDTMIVFVFPVIIPQALKNITCTQEIRRLPCASQIRKSIPYDLTFTSFWCNLMLSPNVPLGPSFPYILCTFLKTQP